MYQSFKTKHPLKVPHLGRTVLGVFMYERERTETASAPQRSGAVRGAERGSVCKELFNRDTTMEVHKHP